MTRFDYIRSARPLVIRRLLEIRLPVELKAPCFAIIAAIVIISAAWMIENYRLANAIAIENGHRNEFEQSELSLSKAKTLYGKLGHLVALAAEVRAIQASGEEEATRFADIGNRLPPHVWLTSIANDESGVALSGKASDLAALSRTISGLTSGKRNYAPTLISAAGDEHDAKVGPLHYELRLERGAP